MGKHLLNGVKGFIKRGGEFFMVDPNCIQVVDGWNDRTDFSGEEELMATIKENGIPQPLLVKKTKQKTLELVDGERRLRAVKKLIKQGVTIPSVPVLVERININEMDLYIKSLLLNNGRPRKPSEQANSYRRLRNWGLSRTEIAKKTGCSISTVRNRLELSNAIPSVQKAVDKGEISIDDANKIIEKSDGGVDDQEAALKTKKAKPKKKNKKTLKLSMSNGSIKYTGIKKETCQPLESLFTDDRIRQKIINAGFNPETIKISISKT